MSPEGGSSDPAQALVSFGSLRVGQEASRRVRLVNRSKRAAMITLGEVVEAGTGGRRQVSYCISQRATDATCGSGGMDIEMQFPLKRIEPFNEELV